MSGEVSPYNLCDGTGLVCENHPLLAWAGASDGTCTCDCGAGMKCSGCKSCAGGGVSRLVHRLRDPAFGTETTERNLMGQAADRIEALELLAHQYANDLRYPPTADSIARRLAAIEAVVAETGAPA